MYQLQVRVVSGNNLPVGDLNGTITPSKALQLIIYFKSHITGATSWQAFRTPTSSSFGTPTLHSALHL